LPLALHVYLGDCAALGEIMSNNDDEGLEGRDALGDDDIDEEKLKGDAIGDTLYSEKWLIQTLMKLTQVGEMDRLSFSD
jgi:hypothetical protein